MKKDLIDYIQIGMQLILIALMVAILVINTDYSVKEEATIEETEIKLQQPYFFLTEIPNDSLVMKALQYYDIKYPEIVLAQAVLETGHYRSKLCKENHNLFGLYNSKKKEYYKFTHWSESVEAYGKYVQYKYKGGDYYYFLDSINYAEDRGYIRKIKSIVKRYK